MYECSSVLYRAQRNVKYLQFMWRSVFKMTAVKCGGWASQNFRFGKGLHHYNTYAKMHLYICQQNVLVLYCAIIVKLLEFQTD